MIDSHAGKERLVRRRSTLHGPVPQEAYKLTRQVGFADPKFIDFATNGEMGIRLSDASKDDGAGLEGRDDRSLFEGNGSQIILRLHVRFSVHTVSPSVDHLPLQASWMYTLEFKGATCGTFPVGFDLTIVPDPHHRLQEDTSIDHTNEVGRGSGKELDQVHRGAFTELLS